MDAMTTSPVGQPLSTVRHAQWFLFGLHVALVAVAPVFTITGFEGGGSGSPAIAVLAALAIGALQLRHSFAAARGERPRGWQWALLASRQELLGRGPPSSRARLIANARLPRGSRASATTPDVRSKWSVRAISMLALRL